MAGSISLSLSQQFDTLGKPLNGGLLYFYAAGTTTPQSAYQDSGLTIPWPNPITLDSAGRVPQLFFADGSIKLRLTDARGVVQLAADGILVIGASSGGGGGSPVDATTILQTGQVVYWYGTGAQTGFVRCNGRTIGSAVSGATERANADTLALFTFLYQQDPHLTVSTGRGASAAADWAANKNIALPDCRGRDIAGLGDMGNSDAARLSGTGFGVNGTVLGAVGGQESIILTTSTIPALIGVNVQGSVSVSSANNVLQKVGAPTTAGTTGGAAGPVYSSSSDAPLVSSNASVSLNGTTTNSGGGNPFSVTDPKMVMTIYMKL